jgi:2-polyprenyl-3-methyl-5-hydroxy-6-metoxy-1,4-benzoquinol methylase
MLSIVQKEDAGNGSLGSVPYYDRHAEQLADGYEGVAFEAAHPQLAALLRTRKGLQVLDVGSGTGRDAAWMARAGHRVTAVEPSTAMRALARRLHPDAKVDWRAGALPDLSGLGADARYDVVLASAVWMHVAPSHRPAAMKRLAGLLGPDGTLFITLRDGPSDPARSMHATSADEVEELGRRNRLKVEHLGTADDLMGRSSIRWHMLALRRS